MLLTNQHPLNKSIMVAVLGAPNAGKSSLINYMLGFELAAVTKKPQTTRNAYHCNFTIDRTEVVLVDTPGVHQSGVEINRRMNQEAMEGGSRADLNLFLIDATHNQLEQISAIVDKFVASILEAPRPCWLVFTKMDLLAKSSNFPLEELLLYFKNKFPEALQPYIQKSFMVSSRTGENVHLLTGAICDLAQPGPHLYPDGSVSNKTERFFAAEYIREQAFQLLRDEVPYEMTVVIDEYKDFHQRKEEDRLTEDDLADGASKVVAHIQATIIVNKPSQRAIVVGSKGSIIKEIGARSRSKIETMVGGKVFLNLHVKVVPNWSKNNQILEQMGLSRAQDSKRVWRQREKV